MTDNTQFVAAGVNENPPLKSPLPRDGITRIPADFPVQPIERDDNNPNHATCGHCGLTWDDSIPTGWTPAPSARCPFEYFHTYDDDE